MWTPLGYLIDEWENFLERVQCSSEEDLKGNLKLEEELRLWASYRGQTLTKTGLLFFDTACLVQKDVVSQWQIGWYIYLYIYLYIWCFSKHFWSLFLCIFSSSAGYDVLSTSIGTSGIPWYGKRWRYLQKYYHILFYSHYNRNINDLQFSLSSRVVERIQSHWVKCWGAPKKWKVTKGSMSSSCRYEVYICGLMPTVRSSKKIWWFSSNWYFEANDKVCWLIYLV